MYLVMKCALVAHEYTGEWSVALHINASSLVAYQENYNALRPGLEQLLVSVEAELV